MDLYIWVDYMSKTPIFQPKTKKDKIYKDKSNTIYTFFLMIIDFQSNKALFWKELLFCLFAADLRVNTDTDILIVQSHGKKMKLIKQVYYLRVRDHHSGPLFFFEVSGILSLPLEEIQSDSQSMWIYLLCIITFITERAISERLVNQALLVSTPP